ncbi:hypothetical protein [Streptosporangium lutulentum]|uniref:FCD domain-containing protein n=1 Tax=Streptosporangium lutulentum TaxID=1461250 RepID=A0ABT9Q5N0_9ACTN|nr:hypothetical protein [Streptosporangium lutulentum]MDP9842051.1 hypothetical protein [Streptosporangium lutulentum]
MPAVSEVIAVHAGILRSDARVLTECAERLREIEARLGGEGVAPGWLRETVKAHIDACVVASGDLAEAATRLRAHADQARRRPPR